jgi:hypothetical protein
MMDFTLGCWNKAVKVAGSSCCFVMDEAEAADVSGQFVVSPQADSARIATLFDAGAAQVLLGESALRDESLVKSALAAHGEDRIGIWLPVRRAETGWGLDTTSNADFSVVAVTNPTPRWIVLAADGSTTDVDAFWWAGQMISAGCSTVLVSVTEPEDEDLLACAEMTESLGERLWLDVGTTDVDELRFWLRYGQVSRLVLPFGSDVTAVREEFELRLAQDGSMGCAV